MFGKAHRRVVLVAIVLILALACWWRSTAKARQMSRIRELQKELTAARGSSSGGPSGFARHPLKCKPGARSLARRDAQHAPPGRQPLRLPEPMQPLPIIARTIASKLVCRSG